MKKILLIGCIMLLGVFVSGQAQADKWNYEAPVDWTWWNECLGEIMQLSGTSRCVGITDITESGNIYFKNHVNFQGVIAEGLSSGIICRVTDAANVSWSVDSVDDWPFTFSYTRSYRFICPGSDNDYHMTLKEHVTINANGETTISFYDEVFECR